MSDVTAEWYPRNFLELARRLLDSADFSALGRCISSVSWKLAVAEYHVCQALEAIPKSLPDVVDQRHAAAEFALLDMMGAREAEPFARAQFICEAHAIAAAQSLHSVPDILSHIVYLSLGPGPGQGPLPVDQRHLYKVLKIVENSKVAPKVADALSRLAASEAFRYLRAYVNTTKHVSLLDRAFGVTLRQVEPERYGLTILSFRYEFRGIVEEWPSKWMDDFLRDSVSFVSGSAIEIGQALEEVLASGARSERLGGQVSS